MPRTSPRGSTARRLGLGLAVAVALWSGTSLLAQIPGRNVNMVAGTTLPDGDPYLQRQNEPSMAASTRNPLHLVAGSNDYRTVDLPGLPDDAETGDAWLSVYKSFDGGQRWSSTLMPGYPQDTSDVGMASPLKGYQAAADPVVRAGTSGLVYYNGLVFDRGDNGKSGIFLARFIDRNNREDLDPIAYLGTSMVVQSTGAAFLDKPWMGVDIPRGNATMCIVGGQAAPGTKVKRNGHRQLGRGNGQGNQVPNDGYERVAAGAIYVAYTSITGDAATLRAEIFLKRSSDCGATWSGPIRISRAADAINQGATIAIDPLTGTVMVAYRRFSSPAQPDADAIMVARLPVGAGAADPAGLARGLRRNGPASEAVDRIFEHRRKRVTTTAAVTDVAKFDQGTSTFSFRTNAYPTMTFDGTGRAYVAWAERGYAAPLNDTADGDSRILITTTTNGQTFTTPSVVDNYVPAGAVALTGHQVMPSLTFAGGKLMLAYYDLRETRAGLFNAFISDQRSLSLPIDVQNTRHTIDIRAALGTPGAMPSFAPSVRVSDYRTGFRDAGASREQLQVNPPNLPMFKQGTVPFVGDYIDLAPSPAFVPTSTGGWAYNTAATAEVPVFHAAWTDNRDVRPPRDGDWTRYAPPGAGGLSIFDGQTMVTCVAGNAGSRNQNIYTSRIGGTLLVGSPGNSKQLSQTLQRGFVIFAQNQTFASPPADNGARIFRMTVLAQPVGGRASFVQLLPPNTASATPPVTTIYMTVPARSSVSRTLYVTSSDPRAQVLVDVKQVSAVGGSDVPQGLTGRVVLNPDIENPDIENDNTANPDIENTEVYNPDIENPDIENPDIENPDIENPDIENPDIENVVVSNPDIENIGIGNPDIENPDIENPDIENPDIENPDIENGTISDVTWSISNSGNTTSAFNVNMFLASADVPSGINTQLILYKTYKTPVAAGLNDCELKSETHNVIIANIPSPTFVLPQGAVPGQNDPSAKNATLWLAPGEMARITLRIIDPDKLDNIVLPNGASIDPRFDPATKLTPGIAAQGVDQGPGSLDGAATKPPVKTPTGTNLFFIQHPTSVVPGAAIAPPVSLRVYDNAGNLLDVPVTISLVPAGPGLSGTTTVNAVGGIAVFSDLSVSAPGTYRLHAEASATGVVATGDSAPFNVTAPAGPWIASGNGTVTLIDDGATGTPAFSYDNPGVFTGAWTLSRVATANEAVNLTYGWTGFHSFFTVTTGLEAFVNRGGTDVAVTTLVNEPVAGEGPVVCCAFPSGGFGYSGATTVTVQAGDTYGFRVRGSHGDGTYAMNGTLSVVVGGTPQFTVNVRATAGGFENQTPGYGPSSVPARVYGGTLSAGQQVTIAASGLMQRGAGFPPNGSGGTGLCDGSCLLPGAPIGSLLARVGSGPWQLVGSGPTALSAVSAGLLQLAVNDNIFNDNTGGFRATVVWGVPASATVTLTNWAQIFDGTPRAVSVTTTPPGLATAVTYNGSPAAPSAIGAYTVEAIAAGPGYLGRASVNETIASTVSAGGSGGGPYPLSGALSCAPGVFASGIRASDSSLYGLGSGQLMCSSGLDPASFVGALESPTPSYTDVTCGSGEVMVGLHGLAGPVFGDPNFVVVATIGPRCQPIAGGGTTDVAAAGGGTWAFAASPFSLSCPAGRAVTGVVGGAGEVVDSIAVVCAPLTP